ncbi:MAG TPA: hypothetical protein VMW19_20645 [Myxococcota bacterium]|nr:hypothetical protein [Myxococcota bacterium]
MELIVEQFVRPLRDGSGIRIVRVNPQGQILDVLSDRQGLGSAEPSPDGNWVLLERYDSKGLQGIQVRSLDGFRLRTDHPEPTGRDTGSLGTSPVWSPDESRFALALNAPNLSKPGRLYPRLAIVSRDTTGYTRVPDSPPGKDPVQGGVIPLFWKKDGIYVRTTTIGSGVLRCDPEGSGCVGVYSPGENRMVLEGREVAGDKALLLVKDFTVNPLEARASEIHEVNLIIGEGRVLFRAPDGVFLSDLDWVGDPVAS